MKLIGRTMLNYLFTHKNQPESIKKKESKGGKKIERRILHKMKCKA
jgi:hypothetical protein